MGRGSLIKQYKDRLRKDLYEQPIMLEGYAATVVCLQVAHATALFSSLPHYQVDVVIRVEDAGMYLPSSAVQNVLADLPAIRALYDTYSHLSPQELTGFTAHCDMFFEVGQYQHTICFPAVALELLQRLHVQRGR
jgi:hypothetical protein